MYMGVMLVIWSVMIIRSPSHLGLKTPPVSPAMECVMNLTIQFFVVYLLIEIMRTYREFVTYGEKTNAEVALDASISTLAFVPMLCILFVGARMRALETDPVNGAPQKWAQKCMVVCAWGVLVQTIASIL